MAHEKMLVDLVKRLAPKTVLEAGCGWGRIARLLLRDVPSIQFYEGFDISPERAKIAGDVMREFPGRCDFGHGDLITANFSGEGWDLVLAIEVLMHIPRSRVSEAIARLICWSRKDVVSVDWWEDRPRPDAAGNFIHPYSELYGGHPRVESIKAFPIPGGLQWLYHVAIKQVGK